MKPTKRLVSKHPKWTKAERAAYAGAEIVVLERQDVKGKIEVELRSGPLAGERRWVNPDEIVQDGDG